MDENTLISAFLASLGANNDARTHAHHYLQSIRSSPGLIPLLLKISLDPLVALELRQVSSIYLKNLTRPSEELIAISAADISTLKHKLISGLVFSVPEKIRSQFEEIARNISKTDYPWEGLHSQLAAALEDPNFVFAGLSLIHSILKNYEFVLSERRQLLTELVDLYFLKVLGLLKGLIVSGSEERHYYVQVILMSYWSAIYLDVPTSLADEAVLQQWMQCFQVLLEAECLERVEKESEADMSVKCPQWMCKKWVAQIINRFFSRYFNYTRLTGRNLWIGQYFQSVWAVQFFKVSLSQLFRLQQQVIPSNFLNYLIKFVTQGIKFQPTFELLDQASVSTLLTQVIMPLLYKVKDDEEIYIDNPIEFIRKEADLGREYFSAKSSAIDMLLTLCSKGILVHFFDYAVRELEVCQDLLRKDALLLALGFLNEQIKANESLKVKIEEVLVKFVYPEFISQIGFLRAGAAWIYSRYSYVNYSDAFKSQGLEAICKLLIDTDLPVRYEAALSLPKLLQWDITKQRLSTELKSLLEIYLNIVKEIHSEDVVEALESLVSAFPNEILPHSLELIQHLSSAVIKMIGKDINEDEGESAMAASSTLSTISKIIDLVEENPEDLKKISYVLKPIFEHCLSEKGCDYFEEALNLLTCLLYYAPDGFLPHLFELFAYLKASIIGAGAEKPYATEHLEDIFSSVANLIKKYPGQTLSSLTDILELPFVLLRGDTQEVAIGCKILAAILENHKGSVDSYIPQIITEVSTAFSRATSVKQKTSCSQVLFTALWNSPLLTLSATPLITPAFRFALSSIKSFKDPHSRTHMLLGLSSIFAVISQLPVEILDNLPLIFKAIIQLSEDTEQNSSVELEEFDENLKMPVSVDAQCQKILEKIRTGTANHGEDDDDDSFDEGGEGEDLYDSPFEDVEAKGFVKEAYRAVEKYQELHVRIMSELSEDEKGILNGIVQ